MANKIHIVHMLSILLLKHTYYMHRKILINSILEDWLTGSRGVKDGEKEGSDVFIVWLLDFFFLKKTCSTSVT